MSETTKTTGYPWLKLWADLPDNPKLRTLTDAQKWRYIHLYLLAGKADAGGLLALDGELLDATALAWYMRLDIETMQSDLDRMVKARLLTLESNAYTITSFMDEQGASQADKRQGWRERQERHRERLKQKQKQEPDEEEEPDIDEEKEKEKEQTRQEEEVTPLSRVTSDDDDTFFSSLTDAERLLHSQIIANAMQDKPTNAIIKTFMEKAKEHGKAKVLAYLAWAASENADNKKRTKKRFTWKEAANKCTGALLEGFSDAKEPPRLIFANGGNYIDEPKKPFYGYSEFDPAVIDEPMTI